jgi:hypothetical protein
MASNPRKNGPLHIDLPAEPSTSNEATHAMLLTVFRKGVLPESIEKSAMNTPRNFTTDQGRSQSIYLAKDNVGETTLKPAGKRPAGFIDIRNQQNADEKASTKRICLDEGPRGKALRTITMRPAHPPQPSLILPSVDANRRPSWEMDGVQQEGSKPLDSNEQRSLLRGLDVLPESATGVHHSGNRARIAINIQDLDQLSQRAPLYHDVVGPLPAGHGVLTEGDIHNIPYGPREHEQEMQRGLQLSRKPIFNAPPWTKKLPWDEMEGITLEEFIIYFPNHIVRWPGLALWLRHQSWDRLFYRTARLINLARSSHYADNRDKQHVEVLPLMMKVERAIQEMAPHYRLADHASYDGQPTKEWFLEHIRDTPANFPSNGVTGIVSLEEAAGYITGVNEFQERAFSARMWELQPHQNAVVDSYVPKKRKEGPKFPFANAFDDVRPTLQTQNQPDQEKYGKPEEQETWYDVDDSKAGWMNPEFNMRVPLQGNSIHPRDGQITFADPFAENTHQTTTDTAPLTSTTPDACALFFECDDFDCPFYHARDVEVGTKESSLAVSNAGERKKLKKKNTICNNLPNCMHGHKCKFLHADDEGYTQALVNLDAKQQRGKSGVEGSPGSQQGVHNGQNGGGQSSQQRQDKNLSNSQQHNEAPPRPPRALCRYAMACRNATCPFGHRSPAADDSVEVDLTQTCHFGTRCNNSRCQRTHSSPVSAGQGQSGGAGRGGHAGGKPHRDGRSGRSGREGQARGGWNRGSGKIVGAHGQCRNEGGQVGHHAEDARGDGDRDQGSDGTDILRGYNTRGRFYDQGNHNDHTGGRGRGGRGRGGSSGRGERRRGNETS